MLHDSALGKAITAATPILGRPKTSGHATVCRTATAGTVSTLCVTDVTTHARANEQEKRTDGVTASCEELGPRHPSCNSLHEAVGLVF